MPGEIFAIIITAIVMATAVARTWIKSHPGADSGSSLTRGELQQLLREAVEEGTAPLEDRVRQLERKVDRQLPASGLPEPGTDVRGQGVASDVRV
ncbi:MAG TPA: hypothetical protein VFG50_12850 [Rhodothermales bacterium]|nr:hypothetical protein [Rhodothermales bacterium]